MCELREGGEPLPHGGFRYPLLLFLASGGALATDALPSTVPVFMALAIPAAAFVASRHEEIRLGQERIKEIGGRKAKSSW